MDRDDRCGTYAGWNVHQKAGERPCAACRAAQAAYMREYRQRPLPRAARLRKQRAARRARARLAARYAAEYRQLLAEEEGS